MSGKIPGGRILGKKETCNIAAVKMTKKITIFFDIYFLKITRLIIRKFFST